ncbi:MAG: hypothetical protein H6742_01370 [Alphaproteobacteria bacterium]|nr:hypothetical protein [Alphaproteobacteria bacterium]
MPIETLLLWTALAGPAAAQSIEITLDEQAVRDAGMNPDELQDEIEGSVSGDLKLADQTAFLQQMARAVLISTKGMGVDYASNPQHFLLGGSVGTGVNSAGARFGRGDDGLPLGGFAFQASLMGGLNLGAFGKPDGFFRRVVIYVDGMYADTKLDPFTGKATHLGAHLQLQLIRPGEGGGAVEWGGLAVTSGYEWARYEMSLEQGLPIDVADGTTWDATGSMVLSADAESIPVEISTNLRILVVSVYAGAGADVNLGARGDSEFRLDGPVEFSAQGVDRTLGTVVVSHQDEGVVEGVVPRGFVGAQAELFMVKLYGQLNVGLDDSFGGHVGARLVF